MNTLTFRLTLWYASVVTVTVALILWAGQRYLESNLISGVDFLNDAEYEEIFHRLKSDGSGLDAALVAEAIRLHTEIDASVFFFQVGTKSGDVLFRSGNLAGHTLPSQIHGNSRFSIQDDELGHLRVGEYEFEGLDIHIASSLQSVDALFEGYLHTMVWILLFVFITSLAIGVFLSRVALGPINAIQSIARRISADNLTERIPVPSGRDEISELSIFLNDMFDRLEGAFEQISRFTADASHELRTPLALIRLHGERLINNPGLSERERTDALEEQMLEIERLNKLVDDLLFIAKADSGVLKLSCQHIDLSEYLQEFSEDAKLLCEEQSVSFEFIEQGEGTELDVDPIWMRHVLLNLLSNALRYAPENSAIRLYSQPVSDDFWSLMMEDEGPGIDEKDVDRIFERFKTHVGKENNNHRASGTGLGLAICRSIVSKHNGRIYAQVRQGHSGLQVHVEIPRSCRHPAC